jgi:predicted histidine transporter YuiF (NhaC family)
MFKNQEIFYSIIISYLVAILINYSNESSFQKEAQNKLQRPIQATATDERQQQRSCCAISEVLCLNVLQFHCIFLTTFFSPLLIEISNQHTQSQ